MSEQFDSADKPQSRYVPDPLSRRLMNRIRKKLKLEEEIHVTLRDIALYALFVICILFMAHGHRNVGKSLMMRRYMESVFIEPRHPPIYSQASGFSTDILELNNVSLWKDSRIVKKLLCCPLPSISVYNSQCQFYSSKFNCFLTFKDTKYKQQLLCMMYNWTFLLLVHTFGCILFIADCQCRAFLVIY